MIVSDVGKLALIAVFLVGLFVLVLTNTVGFLEAAPFFTLVAGYLFGNGNAAVRKTAPSSVIVSSLKDGEAATVVGPVPALSIPTEHPEVPPDDRTQA